MGTPKKYLLLFFWISLQCTDQSSASENELDLDTFIANYVNEVKRTLRMDSEEHSLKKRSHPDVDIHKLQGLELLVGFQETHTVPARFPNDLVLFSQCPSYSRYEQIWFAAALEADSEDPQTSKANEIVLYKFQNNEWKDVDRVEVAGGVRLATEQIDGITYIIVAEYLANSGRGSRVFKVDSATNMLQFVHMLNTQFPSDVIMWTWEDIETFAAVAISENAPGSEYQYSTQSPVYRWLGSHFDVIDTLPTLNPQALAQFNIRSSMFIAVANFQDDSGETKVNSDVFRYDMASGKFHLYQKLPTEAAVDIKYFCFQSSQITESFLIYASAFHKDEEGKRDYNSVSVVYKLSDQEYFVPFQAIRAPRVTSWQPMRYAKNDQESLVLLGASEKGVISYQYDGWKFVPTGVHFARSTFGPGFKSINIFYHNDQTLISAANKESFGSDVNVFSPVFRRHTHIEDVQRKIARWEQWMSRELVMSEAKLTELLRIARAAPKVNDPIIVLGSEVIFQDVEIDHVQTYETRVGKDDLNAQATSQLSYFNSQLDSLKLELDKLQEKIDRTSYHTRVIYEDREEHTADIWCTTSCHVDNLEVKQINGEDYQEFIENTVDIRRPIEFDGEVTFNELALIDPLNTTMINGRPIDSLVDWSKDVVFSHGLKVEGDVILEDSLTVGGTVGGVAINNCRSMKEPTAGGVVMAPSKIIKSLNVSQLLLDDGKLSQVDFENFLKFTLKTQGDQIITKLHDFEELEVDELAANGGLYKTTLPFPKSPCVGKSCSVQEDPYLLPENILSAKASEDVHDIESINLLNEQIYPHDLVIHGTVTIENGSLTAQDLIDSKHNISAQKLMRFGIPLNESVIENHVVFNTSFKTPKLTVDTLNGIDLNDLVDPESTEDILISGRKEFRGGLTVDGITEVTGTVNGVNLTKLAESEATLPDLKFDNFTVYSIDSSSVEISAKDFEDLVMSKEDGQVFIDNLLVEKDVIAERVMLGGLINNFHWEGLIRDTVFNDGSTYVITGKKHFADDLHISNLTLETLNGIDMNTLMQNSFLGSHSSQSKVLEVDKLSFTGYLDGIASSDFGDWLLTEGDQTVWGSQILDSWQAEQVDVPPGGTINNVDINQLLTETVLLTDNVTLNHVVFEGPVVSPTLTVGGMVNGLRVPDDIVVTDSATKQIITAHKHIKGNVTVQGTLQPLGLLSSVNLTAYCQAFSDNNAELHIVGNATFKEEPTITSSVNNKTWEEIMSRVWLKEDNITFPGPVWMTAAQFDNLAVETINNNNVEERLSMLVSLSQDQTVRGTFYFGNVTVASDVEAKNIAVGGTVQGLHLQSFVKNVMLDGVDQQIWGYADFNFLIVDGILKNEGFTNGMNMSEELLLANVTSNNMTVPLSLVNLSVRDLYLPPGSLVAGVDLQRWNQSAVKRSAKNVINGNIVFQGQFDSATGIRVEGFVNGERFAKDNLMLLNGHQVVTGDKTFSPDADLSIGNLQVRGYINGINITDFFNRQVTTAGNVVISGHKNFSSAMYAERAWLPQIYQGYNLTRMEELLSYNLPWDNYRRQMENIKSWRQTADISLAGRAYYLQNVTRVSDFEGVVLFAFPLSRDNSTVIATVSQAVNKTTLSLLLWSAQNNTFLQLPGSVPFTLKVAPAGVQSVRMPGGELAAYITSYISVNSSLSVPSGELFRWRDGQLYHKTVFGGRPGNQLLSFQHHNKRTCFVVVDDMCKAYCQVDTGRRIILPSFPCYNITESTLLVTANSIYLLGLQSGAEPALTMWKLSGKKFLPTLSVPLFNPVSIAATSSTGPHIAVATRHIVGNSSPEFILIYRFNEEINELVLEQELPVISPKKVMFENLPSDESVMYVTSDNPASPLEVFVYRGISGYQHLMVETTLPIPSDISAFTDPQKRHFVVVTTKQNATLLKAKFKGET